MDPEMSAIQPYMQASCVFLCILFGYLFDLQHTYF
jgi:hypothetical protein